MINWGIQMLFEQAGNLVVFYLRELKRTAVAPAPTATVAAGETKSSETETQLAPTDDKGGTSAAVAVVPGGDGPAETPSLYASVVIPTVRTAWPVIIFTLLISYVGYLLFGYALQGVLRNLAVDYDRADDFTYEAPDATWGCG